MDIFNSYVRLPEGKTVFVAKSIASPRPVTRAGPPKAQLAWRRRAGAQGIPGVNLEGPWVPLQVRKLVFPNGAPMNTKMLIKYDKMLISTCPRDGWLENFRKI